MAAADALPRYDLRSRQALAVDAQPAAAVAAAKTVTVREAPLLRILFRVRGLGTSLDRPLWEELAVEGFAPAADDTLVAIARPWKLRGDVRSGDDFEAFAEPGWAKMALDFRYVDGELVTETRVLLTDDEARRRFRRYWLLIRPFSRLVRRSWLKAAKRRAERGGRA